MSTVILFFFPLHVTFDPAARAQRQISALGRARAPVEEWGGDRGEPQQRNPGAGRRMVQLPDRRLFLNAAWSEVKPQNVNFRRGT